MYFLIPRILLIAGSSFTGMEGIHGREGAVIPRQRGERLSQAERVSSFTGREGAVFPRQRGCRLSPAGRGDVSKAERVSSVTGSGGLFFTGMDNTIL